MKQDREFGQHFLINKDVLKKEIEVANLTKKDNVVEIGAGQGTLTKEILKKAGKVLAFEIDESLKEELEKNKIEVNFSDALKSSWQGYNKIVSNIPYNLSEQVVLKAIQDGIEELVLIVGESFKEILEKKETKIGIIADLFFEFEPVIFIDKKSFSPEPRVNSWLIKLKVKDASNHEKILQEIILRDGKTKNAIIHALMNERKTKNQAREILEKMNLDEEVLDKSNKNITGKVLLMIKKFFEENKI